jgi:hypothetical protein
MNQIVRSAANSNASTITRDTIQNLIDGWYSWCGGGSTPFCYIDDVVHPFIPSANCNDASNPATCGWTTASLPKFAFDPESFYQRVPRTYCRTCHVALSEHLNWQKFTDVSTNLSSIASDVFTRFFMPFAEVPYNAFWFDFPAQDALKGFTGVGCPTGLTLCNGFCVNLSANNSNCGACGNVCSGSQCTNGSCGCPAGEQLCSGACVNLKTDRNNCGACGAACSLGQRCSNAECACPAGTDLCCDLGCRAPKNCPKVCP